MDQAAASRIDDEAPDHETTDVQQTGDEAADKTGPAARADPADREAGIAMLTVIAVTAILIALLVTIATSLMSQARPVAFSLKGSRTAAAAQAGLQAGLGAVRAAATTVTSGADTGAVFGDATKLPCSLTGTVDGSPATYTVAIAYYDTDVSAMTTSVKATHAITCTTGSGTASNPTYVIFTSTGAAPGISGSTDAAFGNRVMTSSYTFPKQKTNIPGGTIWSFNHDFCLEAASETSGAALKYRKASLCTAGNVLQTWAYTAGYQIKLTDTVTGSSLGLCITGNTGSGNTLYNVTVTTCVNAKASQLFTFDEYASFSGMNSANTDYSYNRIWAGTRSTPTDGQQLKTGYDWSDMDNSGNYYDWSSLDPDAKVGAGNASATTNQLVNYEEFGRCADVTGDNASYPFMIVYPCKQDPSTLNGTATKVDWNQLWYLSDTSTAPQTISIKSPDVYCLATPISGAGNYVTFTSCATGDATQQWIRYRYTGDPVTSWHIVDGYGRCLTADSTDQLNGAYSKVTVATCTDSTTQRWNSPATVIDASFGNTTETTR